MPAGYIAKKAWLGLSLLLMPCGALAAKEWTLYEDCHFDKNHYADGDSFTIEVKLSKKRDYIFRLYFVDTPESDYRIASRIEDQAEYWNIRTDQTIDLGKDAAKFAKRWFKKADLKIYTKHRDAMGASKNKRYYAMVQDKKTGEFLSMALVRAGLARIYGTDVKLEDGTSSTSYNRKLAAAEKLAKEERLGGWGIVKPDKSAIEMAQEQIRQAQANLEEPHRRRVTSPLRVYSLKPPFRAVGMLKVQMEIQLRGPAEPGMIRVRFQAGPERIVEAQCKVTDLKTRALVVLDS